MLDKFDMFERISDDVASEYICMFLALNDMEFYNKFSNYITGDAIIEQARELLNAEFGYENIYSFSTASFIIMFKIPKSKLDDFDYRDKQMEKLAKLINNKVEKNLTINEEANNKQITISVGVASDDRLGQVTSLFHLVQLADMALTKAKKMNKSYFVTTESVISDELDKDNIRNTLEDAIKNNEFIPYFQPIVDSKTTKIVGCETFVRWVKDYRVIQPSKFLEIAEDKNKIFEIDLKVIEQTFEIIKIWKEDELLNDDFLVNINISLRTLVEMEINTIKQLIKNNGIDYNNICFELQSDIFKYKNFKDKIIALKSLGFKIAIDNFGTREMSIKTIVQTGNFDILKIDRSLLPDDKVEETHEKLYKSLVSLGEIFEAKIISQGVETKKHIDFCRFTGSEYMQGFYFSKVLSEEEFKIYLAKYKNGIMEV